MIYGLIGYVDHFGFSKKYCYPKGLISVCIPKMTNMNCLGMLVILGFKQILPPKAINLSLLGYTLFLLYERLYKNGI